jgi:hypothetical protein
MPLSPAFDAAIAYYYAADTPPLFRQLFSLTPDYYAALDAITLFADASFRHAHFWLYTPGRRLRQTDFRCHFHFLTDGCHFRGYCHFPRQRHYAIFDTPFAATRCHA